MYSTWADLNSYYSYVDIYIIKFIKCFYSFFKIMDTYACSNCNAVIKFGQKRCKNCWTELEWDNSFEKKRTRKNNFRPWILALNRPILMWVRLIISLIFRVLWVLDVWGELFIVIKTCINRLLWIIALLWIPGTVVWIVMLVKNRK